MSSRYEEAKQVLAKDTACFRCLSHSASSLPTPAHRGHVFAFQQEVRHTRRQHQTLLERRARGLCAQRCFAGLPQYGSDWYTRAANLLQRNWNSCDLIEHLHCPKKLGFASET
eukprot:2061780-Amphidinium_carterae.1